MLLEKKILLIEDEHNPNTRLFNELKASGFAVMHTSNRDAAIAHICEDPPPDILLIDERVEGINCLCLLRDVRDHFSGHQLPVMVITHDNQSENMVHLLDAGANDCIALPFDIPVLLARIGVWIRSKSGMDEAMRNVEKRVVSESLGAACHHLAQPVTVALTEMEITIGEHPEMSADLRDSLARIASQMEESGRILNQLRHVNDYHTEHYAGDEQILDISIHEAC